MDHRRRDALLSNTRSPATACLSRLACQHPRLALEPRVAKSCQDGRALEVRSPWNLSAPVLTGSRCHSRFDRRNNGAPSVMLK